MRAFITGLCLQDPFYFPFCTEDNKSRLYRPERYRAHIYIYIFFFLGGAGGLGGLSYNSTALIEACADFPHIIDGVDIPEHAWPHPWVDVPKLGLKPSSPRGYCFFPMETDPKVLVDRAAGAILGVFIGDALGVARPKSSAKGIPQANKNLPFVKPPDT